MSAADSAEQPERDRRAPAVGRRARQRVDEQHQAGGDRAAPARSKWRCARSARLSRSRHRRQRDRREADRDVDEEDPGPAEIRRDDAAEQDAGGRAATRGGAVDAECAVAVASLGERRHQQRERGRREQRAAEPLHRAEGDERGRRPGDAAEEGGRGKQREPRDEHAPAAEQVGEAAAEQQRPPKRIA